MKLDEKKVSEKLPVILSLMWPGMGLILLSKKVSGIIFAIIHVFSIVWVASTMLYSSDGNRYVQEIFLMISLALLIGNWFISFTRTKIEINSNKES